MVESVVLDVSKEETSYCLMGASGAVLARGKVASDPEALFEVLRAHRLCLKRIVLGTGTLSHWLARGLSTKMFLKPPSGDLTRTRRPNVGAERPSSTLSAPSKPAWARPFS